MRLCFLEFYMLSNSHHDPPSSGRRTIRVTEISCSADRKCVSRLRPIDVAGSTVICPDRGVFSPAGARRRIPGSLRRPANVQAQNFKQAFSTGLLQGAPFAGE